MTMWNDVGYTAIQNAANNAAMVAVQEARLQLDREQFAWMSDFQKQKFLQDIGQQAYQNALAQSQQMGTQYQAVQDPATGQWSYKPTGQQTLAGQQQQWSQNFSEGQQQFNQGFSQLQNAQQNALRQQQQYLAEQLGYGNLGVAQGQLGLQGELGRGRLGLDTELGRGNLALAGRTQEQQFALGTAGLGIQRQGMDIQAATQRAQEAYQQAQISLEYYKFGNVSAADKENFAQQKAKQAFDEEMGRAQMTGYTPTGQSTLAREGQEQQTGLGLLNIAKDLRGPANAFQYAKVLQSTPQGMRDIVDAMAGKFTMAGFGGGNQNVRPQAASLGTVMSDIGAGGQQGAQAAQAAAAGLPTPNRINALNYSRLAPTQRDLLFGGYEAQGWRPEDVESQFRASLPKYRAPSMGRIGF